jgi:hypothetical protein
MNNWFALDHVDRDRFISNKLDVFLPSWLATGDIWLTLSHFNFREDVEGGWFNAAYRLIWAAGHWGVKVNNVDVLYELCRWDVIQELVIANGVSYKIPLWMSKSLHDLGKDYHISFTKQEYWVLMQYHGLQWKEDDPELDLEMAQLLIKSDWEKDVEFYITDKPLDSLEKYNINPDYLIYTSSQQLHKLFAMISYSQNT